MIELLAELRANPTEGGIKRIVNFVRAEHGQYFNLRKAIERAMGRPLTDSEKFLVRRLQ